MPSVAPILTKSGSAQAIVDKLGNNPLWLLEGNGTFVQMPNGDVFFYFSDQYNTGINLRISTDGDAKIWGAKQVVVPTNGSWYTICRDPDTSIIYALGASSPGNHGNLYAFKSTDGIHFTAINNGNPVLSQPSDESSIWWARYNWKLVIINGVFHVWADTCYGIGQLNGAQKMTVPTLGVTLNWGQAYTHASLGAGDTLNLETNKSSAWAIPGGNALEAIYIPERKAILFLSADYPGDWTNFPNSNIIQDGHSAPYTPTNALAIRTDTNFYDPNQYSRLDFRIDGDWYPQYSEEDDGNGGTITVDNGYHTNRRAVSDPCIQSFTGKTSKTIFAYNYDQETQCVEYSDKTLLEIYDLAGGIDYSNFPTVVAFSMPAFATGYIVPITTFTGSDGVTGYMLTESATPPGASDAGWQSSPPSSFTFLYPGAMTVFAWVKNSAGYVSQSASATVTIVIAPSLQSPGKRIPGKRIIRGN